MHVLKVIYRLKKNFEFNVVERKECIEFNDKKPTLIFCM